MSEFRKAKRCSTCAVRRIACDQKTPSCSQCLLTGRSCGGYHRQTIFVEGDVGFRKSRRKAEDVPRSPSSLKGLEKKRRRQTAGPAIKFQVAQANETFSTEQDYLISVIINNFTPAQERSLVRIVDGTAASLDSRVCGSWVTLLPEIVARSLVHPDVLQFAIKSLGYSILRKTPQALEAYGETLRLLKSSLAMAREVSFEEILAVILCLTLAEVLLGTEHNGWSAHTRGVSKLVQEKGPEAFKTGVLHQLFAGFRIFMRKESFLDEPAWKTEPFSSEPKSLMQSLLDEISGLPSLLQRLDVISESDKEHQKEEIVALYKDFDTQMLRLQDWEANLKISTNSRVLWWPVASSQDHETSFPISYEFANILVANTMSHYWSFLLVIQISISTLLALSNEKGAGLACLSKQQATISPENRVALAKDICQSMRYHLQPEMGLYGPAATLYPINVALQIFREENKMKEVVWCENFISKLETMGILLASHIPSVETETKKST
ncbi:Zn(2)-C6 fungal-type domain-containing protein [Trichoderma simmonsii]|uniref:Zn(2)-C6 fungal-type domain-containing protein n=1 Tax=Trichoderma simmonsii TaxID=1491479 RepID=A0A8G0PQU7_9HYPO|nr:Zn(2)-C6 fungal-type domain-containing protein [Trichoderma simmonsii]